jgi:hypothetical protein
LAGGLNTATPSAPTVAACGGQGLGAHYRDDVVLAWRWALVPVDHDTRRVKPPARLRVVKLDLPGQGVLEVPLGVKDRTPRRQL